MNVTFCEEGRAAPSGPGSSTAPRIRRLKPTAIHGLPLRGNQMVHPAGDLDPLAIHGLPLRGNQMVHPSDDLESMAIHGMPLRGKGICHQAGIGRDSMGPTMGMHHRRIGPSLGGPEGTDRE